jgi:uncharacterized protein YjbI with pentapeptide repeats
VSAVNVYDVFIREAEELTMETRQTMELNQVDQRFEVTQSSLSGSTFHDVNLGGAAFENVNLARATFSDVNLTGVSFDNVTFLGPTFSDLNLAGAAFDNVNLAGVRITDADLRNAAIVDCQVEGMTIEGVSVAEMMAAYRKAKIENA